MAKLPYEEFLAQKHIRADWFGFEPDENRYSSLLFDWQRDICTWAIRKGRAALFASCGLGKSGMQLTWADAVCNHTSGNVLILAPLAVAQQTRREGIKFGVDVTVCRSQSDVKPGINITNYDILDKFDACSFVGIVLDESSLLKNYTGKTKQALCSKFKNTEYRLCCTATPAPNDHMELGNHAEFLGIMPSNEMLMRWFINDTMGAGSYVLKGHAEKDFWRWVASWAVCIDSPTDLGYEIGDFIMPDLIVNTHIVENTNEAEGTLFTDATLSATTMHREMRITANIRAAKVKEIVDADPGTWCIWCNTNYEADAITAIIPNAVELRGDEKAEAKEKKLMDFSDGKIQILVSKPSLCGHGMNWQNCNRTVFIGLSFSYELYHQALRRFWRFGQKNTVVAHIVQADTEGNVLQSVQRKEEDHIKMRESMIEAMAETRLHDSNKRLLVSGTVSEIVTGDNWELHLGDSCKVMPTIPDESIDFSVYSPPFENLYIYSDSVADIGNSSDQEEFFEHYKYIIREKLRITKPGRLSAVHCKDLPLYKGRDGAAGLSDFPGRIIRAHEECGWTFHSRVTIWKDPVIEMQRTKNHGLLYKNLRENSCVSRQGMADYIIVFRKWNDDITLATNPVHHSREEFPLDQWQEWASPVWMNIRQTNVLNGAMGREENDGRHICPLQIDVIERCIVLWSNPGDVVFSPFAGIGSEGYVCIQKDRKFLGVELKKSYFQQAVLNLESATIKSSQQSLFDDIN